jgi:hypothetical protein
MSAPRLMPGRSSSVPSCPRAVLKWIIVLHGYSSSLHGGGVRHGADLKISVAVDPAEVRLYCNLIRSHISLLLSEFEKLGGRVS